MHTDNLPHNNNNNNHSNNHSHETATHSQQPTSAHNQSLTWQFQKLPNKALWQMRATNVFFRGIFWLFIIIVVYVLFVIFLEFDFVFTATAMVSVTLISVLWLLILITSWFTTNIQYNYTAYHIDNSGLIIRKGMFWRSEIFALRSRIQHIDVAQTPLDRLFGLATIKVYTAGTKLGSISLRGLHTVEAERIRDELISNKTDTL